MQVIIIVLNKHPEHKQNTKKKSVWVDKTGPGVADSEREERDGDSGRKRI